MAGNDNRTFNLKLDQFANRVGLLPGVVMKTVAFDLFGRIVRRTPVDTGRARASWNISVNRADRSVANEIRVSGAAGKTKGAVRAAVKSSINKIQTGNMLSLDVKPGDTIWISNNLPYIGELEDGHSKQAPAGMVAVSVLEVGNRMNVYMEFSKKQVGL